MRVSVRPATLADLEAVEEDIRSEDRAEWAAGTGRLFGEAAREVFSGDALRMVALDSLGVPLCFWGGEGGRVWLFATNKAASSALALHRVLRPNLEDLHRRWGRLEAWADARNVEHHRWLEWLGFEEATTLLLPPFGLPFKVFVKEP